MCVSLLFNRSALVIVVAVFFYSFLLLLHRDMCLFLFLSHVFIFRSEFCLFRPRFCKNSIELTPCAQFFYFRFSCYCCCCGGCYYERLPVLLLLLFLFSFVLLLDHIWKLDFKHTHTHINTLEYMRFDCKWKQGDHWLHRWICALWTNRKKNTHSIGNFIAFHFELYTLDAP